MPNHPHVLVATLGGQPQIITLTLDLLLQRGFPISEVIVLHPEAHESSRLHRALLRLQAEFIDSTYPQAQHPIHFHSRTLEMDGNPIADITDDEHADGILDTLHGLLGDLKRQGYRIHLSVSGGRRLMSLLAIAVAALNFDRHDAIWHLYTPEAIQDIVNDGRLLHVAPDSGVKLIQGPFLLLGAYLANAEQSFRRVQQEQRARWDAQERVRCAEVVNQATPAQLKVLRAFARGLRPQQVAHELCIAPVTVNTHKTVLLTLCHTAWDIPLQERLDYHFLSAKFGDFFQNDE